MSATDPQGLDPINPTYQPLDTAARQFRLLSVRKQYDWEPLRCKLEIKSVDEGSEFIAYSYVWGQDATHKEINLNGHKTSIHRSAHALIHQYMHLSDQVRTTFKFANQTDKFPLVFIDAVCINQADTIERGKQVSLMRDIYSKARLVLLYLGDKEPSTVPGLAKIAEWAVQVSPHLGHGYDDSVYEAVIAKERTSNWRGWNAVKEILSREYWDRLWIVQEMILSAIRDAACIQIGDTFLPYAVFREGVRVLHETCYHHQESASLLTDLRNLSTEAAMGTGWMLRRSALSGIMTIGGESMWMRSAHPSYQFKCRDAPMKSLIGVNERLNVTDDRDRVYGILGLLTDLDIVPNYDSSLREVYATAASAFYARTESLKLMVCNKSKYDERSDLVSWAPDWRQKPELSSEVTTIFDIYDAFASEPMRMRRDGDLLIVAGFSLLNIDASCRLSDKFAHRFVGEPLNRVQVSEACDFAARLVLDGFANELDVDAFVDNFLLTLLMDWAIGPPAPPIQRVRSAEAFKNMDREAYDYLKALFTFNKTYSEHETTLQDPEYFSRLEQYYSSSSNPGYLDRVLDALGARLYGNRLLVTAKGVWSLIPFDARIGDVMHVLAGASMPMVLRPSGEGTFHVIGPAYVHDMMDGQAVLDRKARVTLGDDVFGDIRLE